MKPTKRVTYWKKTFTYEELRTLLGIPEGVGHLCLGSLRLCPKDKVMGDRGVYTLEGSSSEDLIQVKD